MKQDYVTQRFVNIRELAEQTGLSERTIRELAERNPTPWFQIGQRRKFDLEHGCLLCNLGPHDSDGRDIMKQKRITPRLISVRELSEYLGVSVSAIYEWVAENRIPCYRFGRMIRFDLEEVNRWIEERRSLQKRDQR